MDSSEQLVETNGKKLHDEPGRDGASPDQPVEATAGVEPDAANPASDARPPQETSPPVEVANAASDIVADAPPDAAVDDRELPHEDAAMSGNASPFSSRVREVLSTLVRETAEQRAATPNEGVGGTPASSGRAGDSATDRNDGDDKKRLQRVSMAIGFLIYALVGVFIVFNSQSVQVWLGRNRWPVGISIVTVIVAVIVARLYLRKRTSKGSGSWQIGVIIACVIPVLGLLGWGVRAIPDAYEVTLLRAVFLLIVCLLPATMYYLFIASRKSSLLQEYYTNLSHLGLFGRQLRGDVNGRLRLESEMERSVRVMSYIKKFEAVYGPIPPELAPAIVAASNPDRSLAEAPPFDKDSTDSSLGGIFTPQTTIPVVLATLLIGLGWFLTLPPWEIVQPQPNDTVVDKLRRVLQPGEITVHFAFLGAYFFSLQMLFRRYVRKDLRANAYVAVSLRIILAVIGTWAVIQSALLLNFTDTAVAEPRALMVIGFVIGAFPPIAWQIIQAAFRKVTFSKFFVPTLSSEMPVSQLDGLTVWHEARLEEEDIENVPNMATADLVELMLHTRVPANRIVDWVDQAMLYTQVGPDKKPRGRSKASTSKDDDRPDEESTRQRLANHGIRTASALVAAYEFSVVRGDVTTFEKILPGDGRSRIRSLVDTLSTNPNLELVWQWRGLLPRLETRDGHVRQELLEHFR